jgi:hypothetical protein
MIDPWVGEIRKVAIKRAVTLLGCMVVSGGILITLVL